MFKIARRCTEECFNSFYSQWLQWQSVGEGGVAEEELFFDVTLSEFLCCEQAKTRRSVPHQTKVSNKTATASHRTLQVQ
jgi:hypothetical protein